MVLQAGTGGSTEDLCEHWHYNCLANVRLRLKRAEWGSKMTSTDEEHAPVVDEESPFDPRVFRVLFDLAKQYKRQFIVVCLFSFVYTGLDLLQPLVYRVAINAVAGMFVNQGTAVASHLASVPAQTPEQTFRTLMISVVLLYLIAVSSYYVYQRATYDGCRAASYMESKLIVDTFGHVLRLPINFFNHQASAGLARRIDQCDQVAPVVHAVSQQIAPEAVRLVAICAIMLTQNWEMALLAVCLLPPYIWLARRAALKLQSNLDPYYQMWEDISAHIADAIGAVKTVKLSGAEAREEEKLRGEIGQRIRSLFTSN